MPEQIIADLEHISTAGYEWMKRVGVTRLDAFDGISGAVIGVADYGALNDALDEHSADRIADNRARDAWMCAKYGIDPASVAS